MRLRRDTRGEIGVFEDLQTLLVVVVGVGILLGSTLYNWSAISSTEEDQDLYDEAEHIVKQIESSDRLRALDNFGDTYVEVFVLRQSELSTMMKYGGFEDEVRSDDHFNVTFKDLVQEENRSFNFTTEYTSVNYTWMPQYSFGEALPEDKETVVLQVQYTIIVDLKISDAKYDVSRRHPCLVTVVVWR